MLKTLLQERVAEFLIIDAGIKLETKAKQLSEKQLKLLSEKIKELPIKVTGTMSLAKSFVTANCIDLAQIKSKTLMSTTIDNL